MKSRVTRLELPNIIMYEEIDRFLLAIMDHTDIAAAKDYALLRI